MPPVAGRRRAQGLADLGVNHRALYRQYASREDLLLAVAKCGFARPADLLEAISHRVEVECGSAAPARAHATFALAGRHLYGFDVRASFKKMRSRPRRDRIATAPVVKAAALAVRAGNAPPMGRTLVLHVWGPDAGPVGLYRAGSFKARSDRNAVQLIVDAARVLTPAALEPSHHA
jgi:AcrR family transcriptional regulator